MAIVKGPALSIEASGNLGAICYSKWRNLQVAKAVWTGVVPNTTKQVAQQAKMTTVSQAWGGTLNAAERQTWHNLAKSIVWRDRLGSPYVPSGYQLYMKWNIRRLVMGLALMLNAPVEQKWVDVYNLHLHTYAVPDRIYMGLRERDEANIKSYGAEYYMAGPYDSGGRQPIDGEWRFIKLKVPPGGYVELNLVIGKWYWIKGRQVSKFGDVGNWFQEQIELV